MAIEGATYAQERTLVPGAVVQNRRRLWRVDGPAEDVLIATAIDTGEPEQLKVYIPSKTSGASLLVTELLAGATGQGDPMAMTGSGKKHTRTASSLPARRSGRPGQAWAATGRRFSWRWPSLGLAGHPSRVDIQAAR